MINYIFYAAQIFFIWLCLKELKTISSDTRKREELADALEKFAALYSSGTKKKVVSFKAKADDEE